MLSRFLDWKGVFGAMKLDIKGKDKQTVTAIALIAVIVLAGGWVVYSNFFAGSGGGQAVMPQEAAAPPPGAPVGPGGPPPPGPAPAAPGENPSMPPPGTEPPPASQPSAPPPTAPAPSNPGAPRSAARTVTVFGSVIVTYPTGWGIDLRSSGSAAVLTNGKGRFEIHAPNPGADNAKAIADSTLTSVAKDGKVTGQGAAKVAGFDAYQYSVKTSAGPIRIVGVDSPTRIAIVERVNGGALGACKAAFDKMESGLQFR